MNDLTPRQEEVLSFLNDFAVREGRPPTLREIAGHLGVNGTLGVAKHLDALERKGFIRRSRGRSRGIILPREDKPTVSLPVVGTVRAGQLQLAVEDIESSFAVDREQFARGGAFLLRVKGDSMINAAILDGDLALVRPQQTADNRDIVVAMVDGEATLKRFYRERGRIRLQPENPNMEPIIVGGGEELSIVGKVIGIYRRLD